MEGCRAWDARSALKALGAERPGVRFCHPSAILCLVCRLAKAPVSKTGKVGSIPTRGTSFVVQRNIGDDQMKKT